MNNFPQWQRDFRTHTGMSLIAVSAFPKDKFKHLNRSLLFNVSQCLWVKVKNSTMQHILYTYLSMK